MNLSSTLLRSKLFWRIMLLVYLAAVAYCLFASSDQLPSVEWSLFGVASDKVIHAVMFAPFCVLGFMSLNSGNVRFKAILVLFLIEILIAGSSEIIQGYLPTRAADPIDFMADLTGCLVGLGISSVILDFKRL